MKQKRDQSTSQGNLSSNLFSSKSSGVKKKLIVDGHRIVKEISLGVCGTLVDITLFLVCFGAGYMLSGMSSYKGRTNLKPIKVLLKAYPGLRSRLRNALHLAKRDGLIDNQEYITKDGIRRIKEILPRFKRHPIWSGSLWLVTYDISEKRKNDRERLRSFLIGQGYGKLQDSIYVAPFDPTEIVKQEVAKRGIKGEILISKLGKDGHIGEMSIKELLAKIYNLEPVNTRYSNFIQKTSHGLTPQEIPVLFLEYLSILKIDPQLPVALLPENWFGQSALELTNRELLPYLVRDNSSAEQVLENFEFGML